MSTFRTCAILAVALLASCGGDALPARTLSTADVEGQPPGNATGSAFSGSYAVTAAGIEACRCRSGRCGSIRATAGVVSTVVQEDGKLTMDSGCVGGVDTDGRFWCGGQTPVLDGAALVYMEGRFLATGGKPTGYESTAEMTLVATIDGVPSDCDVRARDTTRLAAQ
jgi:hypothetical protein